jgi:hypothetical protein
MPKQYTPEEVAVIVLQKAEELVKSAIGGLKQTQLTPVPGVVSPTNSNTASPMKVGSQAVVKTAKPKKLGGAMDKPSVFYGKMGKSESNHNNGIDKLELFLKNAKNKK